MLQLVPSLGLALRTALTPLGIPSAVTGVYCHGSPLVDFLATPAGGCELGDLLIVVHYRHAYGEDRAALLLQVKLDGFPRAGDAQWRLYNAWPLFIWRHSPRYVRWPRPSGPHLGAQHLVLYKTNRAAQCRLVDLHAPPVLAASEIVNFLCLRSGRRIKDRALARYQRHSGWSEVIWDLLDATAARTVNRARIGVREEPRASGSVLMATSSAVPTLLARAAAKVSNEEWVDAEEAFPWSSHLPVADDGHQELPPQWGDSDAQGPPGISTIVIEVGPPQADVIQNG